MYIFCGWGKLGPDQCRTFGADVDTYIKLGIHCVVLYVVVSFQFTLYE